jgi:HK97 family phage prohead protease
LAPEQIKALEGWHDDDDEEQREGLQDGVAILPVRGTLVKRGAYLDSMSGLTSYEALQGEFSSMMADPDVKAIVMDIDSPGGEVSGMFELAAAIAAARGTKPIIGIANDSAFSAAYCLASCADRLLVTDVGGVGSIGCYMLHMDQSGYDKEKGLKYTYIHSGDRKVDGNPHEPLSDAAAEQAQGEVDRIRQMFVQAVAKNRGVDAQALYDTEAATFMGNDGIPLLADQVGTLQDAVDMAISKSKAARSFQVAQPGDDSKLCGPIAPHKTATSDKSWDGPANEARLKLNQSGSYYRKAYAWQDSKGDETKKASYKFIHHEVSGDGAIGAANIKACQTGIGVLNGGRGGTTIPSGDKKGVYNHLASHLKSAGVEPPDFKGEAPGEVTDEREAIFTAFGLSKNPAKDLIMMGPDGEKILALRRLGTSSLATAAAAESEKITGLLVPYNSQSCDLGGFYEIYQPGCFSEWLKSNDDAQVLGFHNPEQVMGRRSNDTARFWEAPDGLHFEADPPDTQAARDLKVMIARGDVRESSAAFYILQHRWEQRSIGRVRIIEKAKLVEGSPHSFAAYENSTSAVVPAKEDKAAADASELETLEARLRLIKML